MVEVIHVELDELALQAAVAKLEQRGLSICSISVVKRNLAGSSISQYAITAKPVNPDLGIGVSLQGV